MIAELGERHRAKTLPNPALKKLLLVPSCGA